MGFEDPRTRLTVENSTPNPKACCRIVKEVEGQLVSMEVAGYSAQRDLVCWVFHRVAFVDYSMGSPHSSLGPPHMQGPIRTLPCAVPASLFFETKLIFHGLRPG